MLQLFYLNVGVVAFGTFYRFLNLVKCVLFQEHELAPDPSKWTDEELGIPPLEDD